MIKLYAISAWPAFSSLMVVWFLIYQKTSKKEKNTEMWKNFVNYVTVSEKALRNQIRNNRNFNTLKKIFDPITLLTLGFAMHNLNHFLKRMAIVYF